MAAPQEESAVASALQRAHALFDKGQLEESESVLRKLIESHPNVPQAKFILANVCVRTGRTDLAIDLFRDVVNTDPNAFEALEWLANLLRDKGQVRESMYLCGHAIRMRPDQPGGYSSLGLCHLAEGRALEAVRCLREAVSKAPAVAVFHLNLGRALDKADLPEEAARTFRQAIALAPDSAQAYFALGNMLVARGNRKEGIHYFRRAVEIAPSPAALVQLSNALAEDGRHEEAEPLLREAIELDPEFAPAYEILGIRLQDLGRFDEAIASFEASARLAPNAVGPLYGIVRSRKVTAEDRQLIALLEGMEADADKTEEDLRKLHYGLGKAYDDLKQYEKAMRHYDEANRLALKVQFEGRKFNVERERAWFDKLIATFDERLLETHFAFRSDSELPVFVVGMIRSGTTLTDQILTSHPQIGAAGELPFWTDEARTQLANDLTNGRLNERAMQETVDAYRRTLKTATPKMPRVTDKMPLNHMALGLIHLLFPNARIVHVRRNPVDTCLSIYVTPYGKGAEFCYDRESIVAAYREYQRLMEHWRSVLPADRFLEIDYEALVENRETVARRMIAFCGLEWDDACLHHEENERSVRTPSRWQARQPIYASSVERWRRYEPWLGAFRELI